MMSESYSEMPEGVNEDHTGTVVSTANGRAVIHFIRGSMCAHCGGCLAFGDKEMETVAVNAVGAMPGDKVKVALSAKNIVKASFLAYMIPLSALIVGVLVGNIVNEFTALILGLTFCGLSYVVLHKLDIGFRKNKVFEPVIIGFADTDNDDSNE